MSETPQETLEKWLALTDRYPHPTPDHIREAIRAVLDALSRRSEEWEAVVAALGPHAHPGLSPSESVAEVVAQLRQSEVLGDQAEQELEQAEAERDTLQRRVDVAWITARDWRIRAETAEATLTDVRANRADLHARWMEAQGEVERLRERHRAEVLALRQADQARAERAEAALRYIVQRGYAGASWVAQQALDGKEWRDSDEIARAPEERHWQDDADPQPGRAILAAEAEAVTGRLASR